MRLVYSQQWQVHLKLTSEEASRSDRPKEALHEIYDIAIALATDGCALNRSQKSIRLLTGDDTAKREGEEDLPSPCLYVSAGFPCHTLLVYDQTGNHIADVSLSLHDAAHIAGIPATSQDLLQRYHIGRVHIHEKALYVADCEFDLVYVCDLAGDVRHVISWPEELCAPMGMCVGPNRLYVCDSGNKRVRVYNRDNYKPVPGEDSPGHFADVHTRGVCVCDGNLISGDFETGPLLVLDGGGGALLPDRVSPRKICVPGVGEPFAIIPGPLPDSVLVSTSSIKGDHTVKLINIAPGIDSNNDCVLASCGGVGSGPGQFNKPRGLALDPATRRVYAVDARNFRIQVFTIEMD